MRRLNERYPPRMSKNDPRSACISRSGTTINFDGIQPNMEASTYSTFQANKSGFLTLFCITSNFLSVVTGCCYTTLLHYIFFLFLQDTIISSEEKKKLHIFISYFIYYLFPFCFSFYDFSHIIHTRAHTHVYRNSHWYHH